MKEKWLITAKLIVFFLILPALFCVYISPVAASIQPASAQIAPSVTLHWSITNTGFTTSSGVPGILDQVLANVPVGNNPEGISVDPATNLIYVANAGTSSSTPGTVSVIDGSSNTILANVDVGLGPAGISVDSTNHYVYVANWVSQTVSVIDGTKLLSLINNSGNPDNAVLANVDMGYNPRGISVDPVTSLIYVVNNEGALTPGTVSVIDGSHNNTVLPNPITVGIGPAGISVDSTNHYVYVGNQNPSGGSGTVSVIDGNTDTVIANVDVGSWPNGICVDPATNFIYVANGGSGTVSVMDGNTDTVLANVDVGSEPDAICVDPATNRIYVTHAGTVSVIDGSSNNVLANIDVGGEPMGISVDPATNRIYVANAGSSPGTVSVIQASATDQTSTNVTSSANHSSYGQNITLTATVTPAVSYPVTPAGTVMFKDGTTDMGSATINGSGQATISTSSLSTGDHSITAVYNGDANCLGSTSAPLVQTVIPVSVYTPVYPPPTTLPLSINVDGTHFNTVISISGKTMADITVSSPDNIVTLHIPSGTTLLTSSGTAPAYPTSIIVLPDTFAPQPPPGDTIIGIPYSCTPGGLHFNPPLTLTWKLGNLAAGFSAADLEVAFYNTTSDTWVAVPSTYDPATGSLVATISHFTDYAVINTVVSTTTTTVTTTTPTTTASVPVTTSTSSTPTTTSTSPPTTTSTSSPVITSTSPPTTTSAPATTSSSVPWGLITGIIAAAAGVVVAAAIVLPGHNRKPPNK